MRSSFWAAGVVAGLALLGEPPVGGTASSSGESVEQTARYALPLPSDIRAGKSLFEQLCRGCHGANAFGNGDRGVPALSGQRFGYLVLQLAAFAAGQRDGDSMHRVFYQAPMLQPRSWVDVAAFLSRLPPLRSPQVGPGRRTAPGAKIFQEQCSACHGSDARGADDIFAPSLREQHYSYLSNQIVRLAEGHRHGLDEKLVTLMQGLNGTEIEGVADYLSRLSSPP